MIIVKTRKTQVQAVIAYFSMEVGIDPSLPTYSGGLGVLAGDTLRAAADLGVPYGRNYIIVPQGLFSPAP